MQTFKHTQTGEVLSIDTKSKLWKDITKDYEVLSFYSGGKLFDFKWEDKYWCEQGTWTYFHKTNSTIQSVKYLPTGDVFEVDGKVTTQNRYTHIIKKIEIERKQLDDNDCEGIDRILITFVDGKKAWLEKCNKELPIFRTFEGVYIYKNQPYYVVNGWLKISEHLDGANYEGFFTENKDGNFKTFTDKSKAEEYINEQHKYHQSKRWQEKTLKNK